MSGLLAVAIAGWGTSAALALALARRRAAALARGERLAGVVHELRGPLHAAGLILASAQRAAGPDARAALTALELELGRLALAVGDLGRREGRPGTAPVTCDAAALVREAAVGWRVLARAQGRELRVLVPDRPLWVGAERLRLAQALGNLVANALQHGAGDVEVRVAERREGGVRAEVRDGGLGLPASVRTLVARPPDPGRAHGRGLGIAARVAAEAGGRLWSAPAAQGARLVLQVPAPGPGRPAARPTQPLAS